MSFRSEMKKRLGRLEGELCVSSIYSSESYTLSKMQYTDTMMRKDISGLRREIAMMKVAAVDGVRVEGDTVYVTSTIPESMFYDNEDKAVLRDLVGIHTGDDCVPRRFHSRPQLVGYMEGADGTTATD